MNELMKELAELAKAGTEYLKAKKVNTEVQTQREKKWLADDMAETASVAGPQPEKTEPEKAPEAAAGKKPRRTKEQIAADAAAAQAKVTADAQAKLAAEGASGPIVCDPELSMKAELQTAGVVNPLGDLGAFGAQPPAPAPSLKEQIADAQAKTAALQPPAPAPAPAAAAAPKVMTEEESKVNLARSVAIFVKVTAGTGATEEKLDAARNVFRAYMTTTLKAAKVKDLTHDQRLAAIAWLDAETAKHGGK